MLKNGKLLVEVYESKKPFRFLEDTSEMIYDGKSVLGVVEGQFFVPNGESRNGRYYTKKFWESVLQRTDLQHKIKNGLMGGQIGHKETPVSDEDWNKGEISHKITELWIDEDGNGMGKALVLDTPSGRNLNTYLRSGTKLYTSSRASGEFKDGETINGLPVVDENTYYLDTFDFVLNPGFLQAQPKLVEGMNNNNNGSDKMTLEEQMKLMQESINALSKKLSDTSTVNENKNEGKDNKDIVLLQEQFNTLKSQSSFLESFDKPLLEVLKTMSASELNDLINKTIKLSGEARNVSYTHEGFAYEGVFIPTKHVSNDLGRIHNAFTNEDFETYPTQVISVDKSENKYFGSNGVAILWKDRPKNALESIKQVINNNAGLVFEGVGVDLTGNVNLLKSYKALGTPEEIVETLQEVDNLLTEHKEYVQLGSAKNLKKLMHSVEGLCSNIEPLGTVAKIKSSLDSSLKVVESYEKDLKKSKLIKLEDKAKTLSLRFNLPIDSTKKALESMGESKAIEFFKTISKVENNKPTNDNKQSRNEGAVSKPSIVSRINETYLIGGKR